ncbi:hypothetical protein LOD99_7025 [Oopsacas minuta]|uniref:Uncharacterized protein n=1 Tax=Oopsacas minuta TaxID=111878 RepID=A0AAV7JJT5_9METZ|nr:hypothetical protein LOD99_7025 [Oopsacas minuta]
MNASIEVTSTTDIQNTLPKLRTYFCQLLEELKIRRENDRESDKRVKELVSLQHGLEEKLEEGAFRLQRLQAEQTSKLEEQRRMFEDQIKDSDEEKMKAQLFSDTSMKETKSLRDEIRKLHVRNIINEYTNL